MGLIFLDETILLVDTILSLWRPADAMNYSRIALAGLGGTVAYFALGFLLFALLPLADEVRQFAAVYRPEESM